MWHERFMRRYVINLPARQDRRSRMVSELSRMGISFEIFDAIVGKDNKYAAWFYRSILKQNGPVEPGLMGCHLSHAMIWALTSMDTRIDPNDFVLIMEDDLVWHAESTNEAVASLLSRVPDDANMIKFSICDDFSELHALEQDRRIQRVAEGVYLQTGRTGGYLMYGVRKSMLPSLIEFVYPCNFDNIIPPKTYLLLPHSKGIANMHTKNFHFGVCYQGDILSNITKA